MKIIKNDVIRYSLFGKGISIKSLFIYNNTGKIVKMVTWNFKEDIDNYTLIN